jgi:hypothetical protein
MRIIRVNKGGVSAGLKSAGGLFLLLFMAACDLPYSPEAVDVPRPVALNPEKDIFSTNHFRIYRISEGITLIGGNLLTRVELETAPAAALALLGLNPTRLFFDTLAVPDPGPALRFPDTPHVGWSLDTTLGEMRHVRRFTKVENVEAAGKNQQCWVFADSTYLGGVPVSGSTYWMGATGLVRHRQEWKSYAPSGITGGMFWREIKAGN